MSNNTNGGPPVLPGGVNQTGVPTARQRYSIGPVLAPGGETVFENNYQSPDGGQIHIPNPGIRTRPAKHYHQIHSNPWWAWTASQGLDLTGDTVRFGNHVGPYSDRPNPPSFTTGRVAITRRLPVTQLQEAN